MKKKIFGLMAVITSLVLVSPLSGALNATRNIDDTSKSNEDVMYVSVSDEAKKIESNKSYMENNNSIEDIKDIDLVKPVDNTTNNIDNNSRKKFIKSVESNKNVDKKSVDTKVDTKKITNGKDKKNLQVSSLNENNIAKNDNGDKDVNDVDVNNKASNNTLSKEEALETLKAKNSKVEYEYMGNESDFSVLKEKGHEGYVYLPNVETDLGVFVDKNTKEMYYFHPSGYMDIYE